jgi:CheY-like chemotaxis protein/nitrogen-specific signal transduction histidine kinase
MATVPEISESASDEVRRWETQRETQFVEANRHTDEFLATLGHEMRNPLGALSGALELCRENRNEPAQVDELCRIMQRQVRQLVRLSDDLLDVARIQQGKLRIHREAIELRPLLEGALEEVRPFIQERGHTLIVSIPAEPMVMCGDASRLTQVFANLLQNATKFTDFRGSLCVSLMREGQTALVRIRDNGRGIEPRMQLAIFEPFAQADEPHTPPNNGLGIGLRLVKTIVELHEGTVAVSSAGLGYGSEFVVRLPLTASDSASRTAAGTPTVGLAAKSRRPAAQRILVVDDDRTSAEVLARLLRSLSQTVTIAATGAAVLPLALEVRPQIVFLDMVMEGMDGCEVARQLRQHPNTADLALITLSGNGDADSKRRAREAGFDFYLVKPASLEMLRETLAVISRANSSSQ